MKKSKTYVSILALMLSLSLYLPDAYVAMAAPKADSADALRLLDAEPSVSQNTARKDGLTASPNASQTVKRSVSQNASQTAGQSVSQNASQSTETDANMVHPPERPNPDEERPSEPDTVSTADEFVRWLEGHKNGGGRVKLTNNIVLREFYFFTPNGANLPDIIVDTDIYTITAAGNISFVSDGHFIFQGQGGEHGILRVTKDNMLTLDGVFVQSNEQETAPQYALWQEDGAGLILGNTYANTSVSGTIHYADMPFVTEPASDCIIVDKGQTVDGLLPTEIECTVNYQGQLQHHRMMPVSWDLTGTEKQQEKRQRFRVEGFSSRAAYMVPPVCTVVYNDYPLTFTEVEAFIRAKAYYFQGDYTKPKGALPFTVTAQYSFDGSNWIVGEEKEVSSVTAGFCIYFPCDEWDTAQNPYLYIRLQGRKGDTAYSSNVLRYQSDNMGEAEDLGGSRGGGTSIVNPPKDPEDKPDNPPPGDDKPETGDKPSDDKKPETEDKPSDSQKPETGNKPTDSQKPETGDKPSGDRKPSNSTRPSDKESEKHKDTDSDRDNSGNGSPSETDSISTVTLPENPAQTQPAESPKGDGSTDADIDLQAAKPTGSTVQGAGMDTGNSADSKTHQHIDDDTDEADADTAETDVDSGAKESVEVVSNDAAPVASASQEGSADTVKRQQMSVKQRLHSTRNLIIVLGFVTVSSGVGVAAYFIHTSRRRRHKHKRRASGTSKGKKPFK